MRTNIKLPGWVLVEAHLGPLSGRDRVCLRGQRLSCPGEIFEIFLPVLYSGRINELLQLSDDVTGLSLSGSAEEQAYRQPLTIRRVGWFERTWRMANRVHRAFRRLTVKQRARVGLSLWGAFFDLPGAYRITTQFRWRLTYLQWIELCDRLNDEDVEQIRLHIANFALPPHFHILLRAGGAEQGAIRATLDSLKRQLFQNFTCVVLDADGKGGPAFDAEMALGGVGLNSCVVTQPRMSAWLAHLNAALAGQQEWVMMLSPGDVLPAHALYWFASGALARPDAAVLYSDDDALDAEEKRCEPRFKPDWSLAHMRATNFVGDAATLRGSEVAAAGGISPDDCRYGSYDLLLRVIDAAGDAGELSAAHIPAVLLHRMHVPNASSDQEDSNAAWEQQALRAHLSRNSVAGEVIATLPGCRRVRYALPDEPPLVSIIVPTRDEPAIIRQCVESILAKTTYPRFEILVVDNQSADPEALAYLARIAGQSGIRVLRYDRPFNYSAINNFAVSEARGEILCLLNNDTEVISPDWLEEMAGHLLQPKVGVVGAKLFFPDGRVQHAGDTVGPGGCANHLHSFIGRNDPGYCNRAAVAQELSAVTGACMLVWKSLYQKLGGLDEQHLTVAFNDVDFCLRAREAGYRVVWTPHAELFHHESVSRGKDQSPDKMRRAKREVAYMRKRWKRVMRHDPFYNPNLSYERPDFSLSHAPMVKRPWQI